MTDLRIKSEYGTLKSVLMHRPGREIDRLTPYNKHLLLFEDVPYLEDMQREHDYFRSLLTQATGAKVYLLHELLMEVLLDRNLQRLLLTEGLKKYRLGHLVDEFMEKLSTSECATALIAGIKVHEAKRKMKGLHLEELLDFAYLIPPIPNLYFQRDTASICPGGMLFSSMRNEERQREADLVRVVFENHPHFKGQIHRVYPRDNQSSPPCIEGGDLIILSEKAIAVGDSERTDERAIYHLAKQLISEGTIERVYKVQLPKKRNFMHLDTVFTILDENLILTYPDALEAVVQTSVYTLKSRDNDQVHIKKTILQESLADILQLEIPHLQIIHTGNGNPDYALREQWFDGANVLTIAPRRVISYSRNKHTNRALRDVGVEVLEIPSSELSRGLGGPRCMTMPISRADF
ncbi:Arginine deiminase [Lunatimonas lonarensis]|uniref:arginine deiminase n=1 Tax=Lunatimonas lonarensis TaxID=1232681 RepID=R7ZT42_9BACT|nr:arginine deiminase family protein [Lunatimonas lonarensis]EON77300.1 Arginine deiminase [Lunatimonas lonarensis]